MTQKTTALRWIAHLHLRIALPDLLNQKSFLFKELLKLPYILSISNNKNPACCLTEPSTLRMVL